LTRFVSPYINRFLQPDTIIPSLEIPQTWNRYSYAINNPTKFTDPSGHFIETIFDVAMILVDVADIAKNGLNVSNGAALVLDVAAVIIPGVPAVGGAIMKAAKAANAVDNAIDAAKIVNKVDNIADGSKLMNKLGDAANVVGDFCSFSADTEVSTPDGSKTISTIEVGDYVFAWNEADGTFGYYEVTDTFSHEDKVLTELIVDGERVETTPEHPFYVEGKGWTPADELRTGDKIRQADGTTGWVWLKWNIYKTQEMYNLTVDTAHTFFVGEGQWLVHNTCRQLGSALPVNPNSPGGQLATLAKNLYASIPEKFTSKTTIALGLLDDGSIVRTVNGEAPEAVANALGAMQAPFTGPLGHAERYLYDTFGSRLKMIGVSNIPCKVCSNYLKNIDLFYETGRYVKGY
jgi:hypothetical protein